MKTQLATWLLVFLAGLIFAWFLFRGRKFIRKTSISISHQFAGVRESFTGSTDTYLLNDIYRHAQKQHLAAALFSLDEVAIDPRILTPLIQVPRKIELALTDSVSLTIPYIPDWPELAAFYKASTMTLIEALQGSGNIILAGHPGCGKTFALAWLASRIVRNEPGLGRLSGLLPLYVHATELLFLLDPNNPGMDKPVSTSENEVTTRKKHSNTQNIYSVDETLFKAISSYSTPLTLPRLSRILHASLSNQKAIVLLDRMDELSPVKANRIVNYLQQFSKEHPGVRIVVAMSFGNLAGLPLFGYNMLCMAAWGEDERTSLLSRWSQQWEKWIQQSEKDHSSKIDRRHLTSWLSTSAVMLTPLEYTLKVWAAFSGDILGPDGQSAIEAYIRRMTSHVKDARRGLEGFALRLIMEMDFGANTKQARQAPSDLEALTASATQEIRGQNNEQDLAPVNDLPEMDEIKGVDNLTANGFLLKYPGGRLGFSHPIICGYLAGKALLETDLTSQLQSMPSWTGKNLVFYYFSCHGEVTPLLQYYLQEDDILHTNHLLVARWLRIAPKNRPWRSVILRTLASTLQKEKETLSLAAKMVTAMALAGDEGISLFFRQLMKSDHPNLRRLGALGCGILADYKSFEELNAMLQEDSPDAIRTASLALAAIGDERSLELLATSLLNGSELMRRCAAEALANSPKEGYPALQEGSTMEDLLVRRSVIFGLIRVNQPWAKKIVENLQLEDAEWVVRNAAIQAFDELQRKTGLAPIPLADLTESSWLIEYAGKQGTTVAPGKPAEDLAKKALQNGDLDEKLNAIDYFRNKCDPGSVRLLYETYKNSTGELHDAVYFTLWYMAAAGIKLPYSFE